ncbi:MAG TPA: signal peptidase I [Candidatus Saccharimonadales bacterium]
MNDDIVRPPAPAPSPGPQPAPGQMPTAATAPPKFVEPVAPKAGSGSGTPLSNDHPPVWKEILSTVGILATALAVALLIVTFVFRSYQVDGPSMQNTLQNADKLIIWKVPRTWASITHHQYVPARGNIIVFTQSGLSEFGQQDKKQLIKRVIGLPGERVVVSGGVITIYNKEHPDGFQPDKTLAYGKNIPSTSGNINLTLGKNQIFVCGDNRPDSLDSRAFGPIQTKQVVGQLILRVFPLNQAQKF